APRDLSHRGFVDKRQAGRNMMLRRAAVSQSLVDQSARGTSGAVSPAGGGSRSVPAGPTGVLTGALRSEPIRSRTEPPADFCAAMTVSAIEVQMKAMARTHVTRPSAVAAERPDITPPPPP